MAPRGGRGGGGGSSGSGGSSVSCDGCNEQISVGRYGLGHIPTAVGLAFIILSFIGLLVVLGFSFKVKRVFREGTKKKKGTKFGLTAGLTFYTIFLLLILVDQIVTETLFVVAGSYYIFYVFIQFFEVFHYPILVWTVAGFLWTGFYKLKGNSGLHKWFLLAARILSGFLFVLALARFGIYIRFQVINISSLASSGVASYSERFMLAQAIRGLAITVLVFVLIFSIAVLGLSIKLFLNQRSSHIPSKAPLALMVLTAPFLCYRSLATLAVFISSAFSETYAYEFDGIISAFTYYLPSIFIWAGLVWAGTRPDWYFDSRNGQYGGTPAVQQTQYSAVPAVPSTAFNNQNQGQAAPYGDQQVAYAQAPQPQQNGAANNYGIPSWSNQQQTTYQAAPVQAYSQQNPGTYIPPAQNPHHQY